MLNTISSAIDRFCYKHPNFGIPNLMLYIVGGNIIVFILDMMSSGTFSKVIYFVPEYILQGQIWRLITFIFVPEESSVITLAISLYFYYFIGSQLENHWGTARFNVFYFSGVLLSILTGLIMGFAGFSSMPTATMQYVNLSMFFAFATLYPDMRVLLFFVIPVKVKWLAYLDAALFGWSVVEYIIEGKILFALLPIIAMLNYFIFFGADLLGSAKRSSKKIKYQHSGKVIQFKKATGSDAGKSYMHKCCVCGRTDAQYPDLEFRYCSLCAGYRCYCIDHINNHVHITE